MGRLLIIGVLEEFSIFNRLNGLQVNNSVHFCITQSVLCLFPKVYQTLIFLAL
jgi:hypothetical protein